MTLDNQCYVYTKTLRCKLYLFANVGSRQSINQPLIAFHCSITNVWKKYIKIYLNSLVLYGSESLKSVKISY